jgi:hypothetical protein
VYHSREHVRLAVERSISAQSELLSDGDDIVYAIALTGAEHAAYLDAADGLGPGLTVSCRLLSQAASGLGRFAEPGEVVAVRAGTRGADELPDAWPLAVGAAGVVHDMLGGELWVVTDGTASVARRAGATSDLARTLAAETGLRIADDPPISVALPSCDEAFIVGMPFCVLPIAVLDSRRLSVGPAANALTDAWSESVGIDLRGQLAALATR